MSNEKWYLGKVSRQRAEDLLHASGIDGSFVIRSSESVKGAFALSVLYSKSIHTYRILPTEMGLLAVQTLKGVQQRKFSHLDELVKEYKNPQNGLVCGLTIPVGPNDFNQQKLPNFEQLSPAHRAEASLPTPLVTSVPSHLVAARSNSVGAKISPLSRPVDPQPVLPNDKKDALPRDLPPLPREQPQRPNSKLFSSGSDSNQPDGDLKAKFLVRLNDITSTWSGMDNNFMDSLQTYTNEGGLDADLASVRRGNDYCAELQTLLAKEAVSFQRELEIFITKTDILRQLFDHNLAVRRTHAYNRIQDSDVDLDTFLGRLRDCQTVVKSLNIKACSGIQSMLGLPTLTVTRTSSRKPSKAHEVITERIFEVKQEGALKFSKQKLKMDIKNGTLSLIKADGTTEYNHSKVLQLIKNNKSKNKLTIVFDGNKKKDFTFEQSFHREAFCQLMQYMRNKHSASTDPDCVSIFCGSWNMGDAIPPNDISSWLLCNGSGKCLDRGMQAVPHDIYVIGTQETGMQERDWMHKVVDTLQEITGKTFHLVVMDALWHIKIMLIVKDEHKNRISHVQTSTVKTGIANALGNKGAVAVSFQFGGTSFCFINAHLTSGSEKCARRNNNYHDIIRNLNLGEDRFRVLDLTNRFDHLYFFGDLNYRLEMDVNEILGSIHKKDLAILHKVDQLRREKDSNKVFSGFNEEEILFPPTYRYERGNRENYAHIKVKKTGVRINVPSWCDRILWRSYPETHNVCHAYGCSDDIMTSDHSPLFSNFQVGVRGQYVSNEDIQSSTNNSGQSSITFENIETIMKAPGKSNFYLQFHSLCLTSSVKSRKNQKLDTTGLSGNHGRLTWSGEMLPKLEPIISDREFLVDQHLLICIRTEDDSEVHGECVIALRSMIGTTPQNFDVRLTRKGDDVGEIRGRMHVKARESQRAPREKTYDFIRIHRDDEEKKKIKEMGISMATYAGIDEIKSSPTVSPTHRPQLAQPASRTGSLPRESLRNAMNASVGVYVESEEIEASEDHYADPDLVISSSPKRSSSFNRFMQNRPPADIPIPSRPSIRSPLKVDLENKSKAGPVGLHNADNASPSFLRSPKSFQAPVPPQRASLLVEPPPRTPQQMDAPQAVPRTSFLSARLSAELAATTNVEKAPSRAASNSPDPKPRSSSPLPSASGLDSSPYDRLSYTEKNPPFSNPSPYMGTQSSNVIPAKHRTNQGRGKPTSVQEFLSMINLMQYTDALQDNGWDNLEFLGEITEHDLFDSGITNPDHCHVILEAIKTLPQ